MTAIRYCVFEDAAHKGTPGRETLDGSDDPADTIVKEIEACAAGLGLDPEILEIDILAHVGEIAAAGRRDAGDLIVDHPPGLSRPLFAGTVAGVSFFLDLLLGADDAIEEIRVLHVHPEARFRHALATAAERMRLLHERDGGEA